MYTLESEKTWDDDTLTYNYVHKTFEVKGEKEKLLKKEKFSVTYFFEGNTWTGDETLLEKTDL